MRRSACNVKGKWCFVQTAAGRPCSPKHSHAASAKHTSPVCSAGRIAVKHSHIKSKSGLFFRLSWVFVFFCTFFTLLLLLFDFFFVVDIDVHLLSKIPFSFESSFLFFLCPWGGQLVAWRSPDALVRIVGMLCLRSVCTTAWQIVAVPSQPHKCDVVVVVETTTLWWGRMALPTLASQSAHPMCPMGLSSMSYMVHVLTNGVALLTANHSYLPHSLSSTQRIVPGKPQCLYRLFVFFRP